MLLQREFARAAESSAAEIGIAGWVCQSANDGFTEACGARRIGVRQAAIYPFLQPLGDASAGEGSGGDAVKSGFESSQSKGLGPEAGHDREMGAREAIMQAVSGQPS